MIYLRENATQPRIQAAINEIRRTDNADVDVVNKAKTLLKFGRNTNLGTTRAMIWNHAPEALFETLPASNTITTIVSSNAADNQQISVEHHTLNDGNLTFGTQTVTLNGQTPVTLPTAAARVSRLRNIDITELAGDIYAYQGGATTAGVPDDADQVHAKIDAGDQQTRKAATSVSAADYLLLTQLHGQLRGSTTARVELELERRSPTGVWLPTGLTLALGSQGTVNVTTQIDPCVIIPANHEVRAVGESTATGTDVSVYFGGYFAAVT